MASDIKKVVLDRTINNSNSVIYPKTSADIVEYKDSTVQDELDSLNQAINNMHECECTNVSLEKINSLFK